MTIVNGYTDLDTLRRELNLDDGDDDPRLERIIEAVSRNIDHYTGWPKRHFFKTSAGTQRHFTASQPDRLFINDADAITAVAIDTSGDGTYEDSWTVTTHYILAPYDADSEARPFTAIEVAGSSGKRFPVGVPKGVRVTGTWGWPAVPDVVEEACLIQCARIAKRAEAPFGVAAVPTLDGGGGIRLSSRLDPDVELLLKPLRRTVIGVG